MIDYWYSTEIDGKHLNYLENIQDEYSRIFEESAWRMNDEIILFAFIDWNYTFDGIRTVLLYRLLSNWKNKTDKNAFNIFNLLNSMETLLICFALILSTLDSRALQ